MSLLNQPVSSRIQAGLTTQPYPQSYLPGSVTVTYTAGTYGDGVEVDNCPQTIKQAMLLLISYWYNHRDSARTRSTEGCWFGVDATSGWVRTSTRSAGSNPWHLTGQFFSRVLCATRSDSGAELYAGRRGSIEMRRGLRL